MTKCKCNTVQIPLEQEEKPISPGNGKGTAVWILCNTNLIPDPPHLIVTTLSLPSPHDLLVAVDVIPQIGISSIKKFFVSDG